MKNAKCKLQNGKAALPSNILHFALPILHFAFLPLCLPTLRCLAAPVPTEQEKSVPTNSQTSLANAFARLLENAIPRQYEKRKDWGQTKNITVGIRNDGWKLHRRKKPVKHGTWKHYKIRLIEPQDTLDVQIENLRATAEGRLHFTLKVEAEFDLWARAKVYRYGIHLLALELVGDAAIDLSLDCEIGMQWQTRSGKAGIAIDPLITASRLDITDFHLHRVSNAKGPIIRELGEELPRIIERELQGPKLVAKLNRAIEKKRDRLELSFAEIMKSD